MDFSLFYNSYNRPSPIFINEQYIKIDNQTTNLGMKIVIARLNSLCHLTNLFFFQYLSICYILKKICLSLCSMHNH